MICNIYQHSFLQIIFPKPRLMAHTTLRPTELLFKRNVSVRKYSIVVQQMFKCWKSEKNDLGSKDQLLTSRSLHTLSKHFSVFVNSSVHGPFTLLLWQKHGKLRKLPTGPLKYLRSYKNTYKHILIVSTYSKLKYWKIEKMGKVIHRLLPHHTLLHKIENDEKYFTHVTTVFSC